MGKENSVLKEFMSEISDIRFLSVDDFMKKKEIIRDRVEELDNDVKEIYQWYFYHQLCILSQKFFLLKDLMWLYACGERVEFDLMLQYRLFCEKRNKIDYGL